MTWFTHHTLDFDRTEFILLLEQPRHIPNNDVYFLSFHLMTSAVEESWSRVLVFVRDFSKTGPSRATAGPGKHHRGALSPPPHSVCLVIETPKASKGMKRGEGCPLTIRL